MSNATLSLTLNSSDGSVHQLSGSIAEAITAAPPAPPVPAAAVIPANAVKTECVAIASWPCNHDAGTPGTADCTTAYPVAKIPFGSVRKNAMTYTAKGGGIWHPEFGSSQTDQHFVYDIELSAPDWSQVMNFEMDINHADASGNVTIIGTQMAGGSGTFEYTLTPAGKTEWLPSNILCDPRKLAPNSLHRIQIATHHNGAGVVLYDYVIIDGVRYDFEACFGLSCLPLKWAANVENLQLQIDGAMASGGSIELDVVSLIIWHW